jgi:hypothetical protein
MKQRRCLYRNAGTCLAEGKHLMDVPVVRRVHWFETGMNVRTPRYQDQAQNRGLLARLGALEVDWPKAVQGDDDDKPRESGLRITSTGA